MIVDDDQAIRLRLRTNIDWEALGVSQITEATDGIEALEKFEEHRPQIILLDINLPHVDGLSVATEILSRDAEAIVIIITGFNEFEYAQRALQIGVDDLLAKPLDMEEVRRILAAACQKIAAERRSQQERLRLLSLMSENIEILQHNFIRNLLNGQVKGDPLDQFRQLNLDLAGRYYCVAEVSPGMNAVPPEDIELMTLVIGNIGGDLLSADGFKNFIIFDEAHNLSILLSFDRPEQAQLIDQTFIKLRNKYNFYFNYDLIVGIGSITETPTNLKQSRADAREALNYHTIFGQNNVVNIKNVVKFVDRTGAVSSTDISALVSCFQAGELDTLQQKFDELIGRLLVSSTNPLAAVRRLIVELTVLLLQIAADNGVEEELFLPNPDPYSHIMQVEFIPELIRWFRCLAERLHSCIVKRQENKISRVVASAVDFIEANFHNSSLSLDNISEYVGLSSVYFSKLFHKHIGSGISQYINERRIEHAKLLLRSTDKRIFEVAEEVGYNNPRYFNYVFKKTVGMSPNVWRNMDI